MAILGILYSLGLPMVRSMRGAAFEFTASNALRQLGTACSMYAADHDDTFPPAMYPENGLLQTWFGRQTAKGTFDPTAGLLSEYTHGKTLKDPIFEGREYLGDASGFGYNWGYIGSDMHISGQYGWFPFCANPARGSELADGSRTVLFATSAFFNARWLPKGDGGTYRFGFIDPPRMWDGNPNVDYRHKGQKQVNEQTREVFSDGNALIVSVTGTLRSIRQKETRDDLFVRVPPGS